MSVSACKTQGGRLRLMVVEGKKCQFTASAITLKLVEGLMLWFFYHLSLCDTVEIKKKKELIV